MKLSYKKHYSLLETAAAKNLKRIEKLEKAIDAYCNDICHKISTTHYDGCKKCPLKIPVEQQDV